MGQSKKQSASGEFSLKDLELDPKSVKAGEYPQAEVYWLHYTEPESEEGEEKCGLFWKFDLKDYLQKNMQLNPNFEICPYAYDPEIHENWYPLFEEPFFQRRKETPHPHEVASQLSQMSWDEKQSENAQSAYLLVHGQKIGPYTLQDIRQQLNEGSILVTDMISVDGGKSWGHLYEITEFDRRVWDPRHLPHRPEDEHGSGHFHESSEPLFDEADDLNVVADLAHQGFTGSYEAPTPPKAGTEREWKGKLKGNMATIFTLGVFIFCTVALSALYFVNSPSKHSPNAPVAEKKDTGTEKKETNRSPAQVPHHSAGQSGEKDKNEGPKESEQKETPDSPEAKASGHKKDSEITVKDTSRDDRYYDTQKKPTRLEPVKRRPRHRETASQNRDRSREERGRNTREWGNWEEGPSKNAERDPYRDERYPRKERGPNSYERGGREGPREGYKDYRGDYREYEDVETYRRERDDQRDMPPKERGWGQ